MHSEDCIPTKRNLYAWEIQEARRIFGNSINYDRVRIHECARWPNNLDRAGRWVKRLPPSNLPNAVTLGNHCFFPILLPQVLLGINHAEFYKIPWLMHELAHVWQYQQKGWVYLPQAIIDQIRKKAAAYDFGGEEGLVKARADGRRFRDLSIEQQGEFCRAVYFRISRGQDTRVFQPFIDDIQSYQHEVV